MIQKHLLFLTFFCIVASTVVDTIVLQNITQYDKGKLSNGGKVYCIF